MIAHMKCVQGYLEENVTGKKKRATVTTMRMFALSEIVGIVYFCVSLILLSLNSGLPVAVQCILLDEFCHLPKQLNFIML